MKSSLALRLTFGFALAGFVLVAGASAALYRTLLQSLAAEDDQQLVERLAGARAEAVDTGSAPPGAGPLVRILSRDCRPIGHDAAPAPPPPCDIATSALASRDWESADGRLWRVLSARLDGPEPRVIQVMLDRSTDVRVLREYRTRLGFVLVASVLVAAGLGYGVARRGLAPLARLAADMRGIDARSLDRRVGSAEVPVEVAAVAASVDGMLARLDDAFRALAQSSGELAHELRTPLHVLRQQAEVALTRARDPAEYREVLASSLEEIDRLHRMTDDILFLARAEDPRAEVRRARLDVASELADVAAFFEALASERGVGLDLDAPAGLALDADRTLVRRALVNVVTNALVNTPAGGRVRLAGRGEDGSVTLEVWDTGRGIPPDVLPYVFERHFRGSAADDPPLGGSGLGLPIVRSILALHGGTATIESTTGRGTCVSLRFPPVPLRV